MPVDALTRLALANEVRRLIDMAGTDVRTACEAFDRLVARYGRVELRDALLQATDGGRALPSR